MGCCGKNKGGGVQNKVIYNRGKKKISKYAGNRGVMAQRSLKSKPKMRTIKKRTCPKCGWPMSHNIASYDSKTKKAIQVWTCTNKKRCAHRIVK